MKELYREEELEDFIKMGFSRELAIHIVTKGKKELGDNYDMAVGARLYFKPTQPKLESANIEGRDYSWWEFKTEGVRDAISINRLKGTTSSLPYFDKQNENVEFVADFDKREILIVPEDISEAIRFIENNCFDKTVEVIAVAKECGKYSKTLYLFEIVA